MVNTSTGMETHVLPQVFGSRDLYEMEIDMPSPEHSPFVAATSPASFIYVARTVTKGNNNRDSTNSQGNQEVARTENVSSTSIEPYCNVPPIPYTVTQGDEEGGGFRDEKSIT